MNENVVYILIALVFLAIGFLLACFFAKLKFKKESAALNERINLAESQFERYKKSSLEQLAASKQDANRYIEDLKQSFSDEKQDFSQRISSLQAELKEMRALKDSLQIELTKKDAALTNSLEKLAQNKSEIEQLQEKFSKEFENLANKILDEKSKKFTEQNKLNIKEILNPLQEKIHTFEEKVERNNNESIKRHAALGENLKFLHQQNVKISEEANNLTKALKGESKTQGNWGELILERVLEKSGLEKGREYEMEKSFSVNEENRQRLRPDVIIYLPGNKKMIVDSKVSLTAYEKYVNSEQDSERIAYLKDHVASINRHVTQLSDKKYEDLYEIESPDFVLLFIPVEPAFAVALNQDNQLYNKAFEKNIVIVTPSTLLATLRTIDSMWNNEKQQRNALEIARQAGALYDKFEGLVRDLTKIGKKMDEAKDGYKDAMNKLTSGRGNLIRSVEKIKKMGAKAKKSLPESYINRADEE